MNNRHELFHKRRDLELHEDLRNKKTKNQRTMKKKKRAQMQDSTELIQ